MILISEVVCTALLAYLRLETHQEQDDFVWGLCSRVTERSVQATKTPGDMQVDITADQQDQWENKKTGRAFQSQRHPTQGHIIPGI